MLTRSVSLIPAVFALLLLACASSPEDKKNDPAARKFVLACPAAILTKLDSQGKPGEKGKVILGTLTCDAAAKLDDRGLMKLKRTGVWEAYSQGARIRVEEYVDGKKDGPETGYYAEGGLRYQGQNKDDKRTGHWIIKAGLGADCTTEGDYEADLKVGKWKECTTQKPFFVLFEGSYVQGLRDGPAVFYGENGKITSEGSFRADLACKAALKPGAKKEEFDACGKRTGKWTDYHSNGQVYMEGEYDPATGKEMGTWREFYLSGEKMAMGPRNGDRSGQWTFYDKSGTIIHQFDFDGNDFMPKAAVLWKDGRKIGQGKLSMGLCKYDNGKDQITATGLIKDGPWIEYHANGQKSAEGTYVSNRKDGKWAFYNEAGQKTAEGRLLMEKKDGEWMELENGQMVKKKYQFGRIAPF
jgi:antitoxin component YwqK of YwqJK toxin-antitoxin module